MSDIIKLNVGGFRYETTLNTLEREPESMLASMFSGRHKLVSGEDGYHFIDRNGEVFKYILKYLRDGKINLENLSYQEINDVLDEADYFNIQSMIGSIQDNYLYAKKKLDNFDMWYCSENDTYWKLNTTDLYTLKSIPPKFERYYTFLSSTAKSVEIFFEEEYEENFKKKHMIVFKTPDDNLHFYKFEITDEIKKIQEELEEQYDKIKKQIREKMNVTGKTESEIKKELENELNRVFYESGDYFFPIEEEHINYVQLACRITGEAIRDKFGISDKYFVKLFDLIGYTKVRCRFYNIYYNPNKGREILEISFDFENYIHKWNYEVDDCDDKGEYYSPIIKAFANNKCIYLGYKYIYDYHKKPYLISILLSKDYIRYVSRSYSKHISSCFEAIVNANLLNGDTLKTIEGDYDKHYQIFEVLLCRSEYCYYEAIANMLPHYDKYISINYDKSLRDI